MRALFDLESTADAVYNPEYHHKARGVIWSGLSDTDYAEWHGEPETIPFCFSNPFPVSNLSEGDTRHFIVSSPHSGLVKALAERYDTGSEFNIGEMGFEVQDVRFVDTDVGAPGATGALKTDTGVFMPIPKNRWDEFGISPDVNGDRAAWTPNMPLSVFLKRARENTNWKRECVLPDYLRPIGDGEQLFDQHERLKTYSVDVPVTSGSGYEYTFVVSKWRFEYTVRNSDHRRWLNLLLDSGIGMRNSLGFGFMNLEVNND